MVNPCTRCGGVRWAPLTKDLVICTLCGRIHTVEEAFGSSRIPELLELLKPSEVARFLKVSSTTIDRWVREGKIRAIRLPDGRLRIPEDVLLELVGGEVGVPPTHTLKGSKSSKSSRGFEGG